MNFKIKKIFVVVFLCIILLNINNVFAATIDNTPPKLISFKVKSSEVKPGEYLELEIKAEDDVSGIKSCSVGLYDKIKGYAVHRFDIFDLNNIKIQMPEDMIGGEYLISDVMLQDNNNNLISYYNNALYDNEETLFSSSFDFKNSVIKIVSNTSYSDDKEAPVVSDVTISSKKILLGESITVCAKVSDNSKIKHVTAFVGESFNLNTNEMSYEKEKELYCTTINPTKAGTFSVSSIYATDIYENINSYILPEKLNYTVEGPASDEEAPKLISLKVNKTDVIAPEIIKIFVDATDNSGEISKVFARFISEEYYEKNLANKSYSDGELAVNFKYDSLTGKYTGTIDVNQYSKSGKYYLQYLILTDKSQNSIQYTTSHYPDNLSGGYTGVLKGKEKIEDYYFEVKKEFDNDEVTSTTSENLLEIINRAQDNAIIMINAKNNSIVKSEVFEAIKNTNKTIYIESNGYQWVFNGKDIKNPKTIDTHVYTELLADNNIDNQDQGYVAIVFAENGVLPGKATIRIKADYTFRFIEGYEKLKLYFYNSSEDKYKPLGDSISLSNDGFYEFEIEHNSRYVMTDKDIKVELLTNEETDNSINTNVTDNNENRINKETNSTKQYIIIGSALVIVIIGFVLVIKSKNKK